MYSSSPRDISNNYDYDGFLEHYEYVIKEIHRITMPGRITAVHCADIPRSNSGYDSQLDLSGDIIRYHEKNGFEYVARHSIWKEPLRVRNRTMAKCLAHKSVVDDATACGVAGADYLLIFRKKGKNPIPVKNETGLSHYAGEEEMPKDLEYFRNWEGNQIENKFSHWIWRRYASSVWMDIRIDRVLPYKESKEEEDEKHVHPLQLDVIDRVVTLRSNIGETVFTPFMGVGSEVYGAVALGRKGIGVELKESYYNQAVKNMAECEPYKDAPKKSKLF